MAAAGVVQAGGAQQLPPTDIPGIDRFAVVSHPQGVVFYVMRGVIEGTSTSSTPLRTGHCHWNELETSDQVAALAFYRGLFGWEKGDAMSMDDLGDYQFTTHHGEMIGAMMSQRAGGPSPAWTFYFGVDDIDAAARAVSGNSGMVQHGPAEVPGRSYIIVASDPQGALFGLVGPRTQ